MLATAGDLAGLQFAASMRFGRTPAPIDFHPNLREMLHLHPDGFGASTVFVVLLMVSSGRPSGGRQFRDWNHY